MWHGVVNPPRTGKLREWSYTDGATTPVKLGKGDEMGRFLLGSTVVMLFPSPGLRFDPTWEPGRSVRLGESMATYT